MVGSIKLPDSWYTQTGKEALERLYQIIFRDTREVNWPMKGQEWPNLGAFVANKDCKLYGCIINQSKTDGW
jgi:hypothetical protein